MSLPPASTRFLRVVAAHHAAGRRVPLADAMRGRNAVLEYDPTGRWDRTHAVNDSSLCALNGAGLIEYGPREPAPVYYGRQRGDADTVEAVILTPAGRAAAGLPDETPRTPQ